MRTFALIAFAVALAAQPARADDLAATAAAVRDKALVDDTAWRIAESLTTEVGARPTGSPAMTRARDWGVATLKELGFENVAVESYTAPAWFRGPESAEITAPYPHKLHVLGLGRSAPTPTGGVEGEVVLFGSLDDLKAQAPGSLNGKIAVVTQEMVRTQDGSGYGAVNPGRTQGAIEASKRGAVAYLVRSISTDDTRLPHTGNMARWGDARPIPAAALSPPDSELLERMAARGEPIRVRLNMASTMNEAAPAWNVVGEIRGRERPDEVIIIGGHLDSWDVGTGAVDDAAGIAITTAAAKLIADLPQRPRRTIRVVMWGAEEQGGAGTAYAAGRKDEMPKIVLVGESDSGAGAIWSVKLPKGSREHPAMQAFAAAAVPLKVIVTRDPAQFGGADVAAMVREGAPVVDFAQDMSRYFDLHHSDDDTLDKIDPAELAQNVAVWAAFIHTVADSDIDFRHLAAESQ